MSFQRTKRIDLRSACYWCVVAILLALYAFVSVNHLAVFPPMGEDEPWIAASPYKLVTQGIYGSDLFAGYYGMDQHNFDHMPVYPLLEALVFKIFGVGVFQMRMLPVALGFILLLLVLAVGYQLGSPAVGMLAIVLLVGLRVAAGDNATGILLLDQARINRYDIAVPVFGLIALLSFNRAERTNSNWWFAVKGLFVGLSSLSHLYGLFWLPAFFVVLICRRGRNFFRQGASFCMLAGFVCMWLPWSAYVASNWTDYVNQTRNVAGRFEIFESSFYISNAIHEVDRYRSLGAFDSFGGLRWPSPGNWTLLLGVPAALAFMLWRTRHHVHDAVFALAAAAIVQTGLFTLFLKAKTYGYLIALWPLGALALAWLAVWLWREIRVAAVRAALVVLLVFVLGEGAVRVTHTWKQAEQTAPYNEFTNKVAACIPQDSLVLGLQHYWLGLRQYPYRTWLLPLYYTHPAYYHAPIGMNEALERVRPDVVLIDRYMHAYFESIKSDGHPDHALYEGFQKFMAGHDATLACTVEDKTYDVMRVYVLKEQ